ncbi:glycoside hydrolase family 28 protein [uncultured Paludibaculum sp.]|uniref:glycoside hydrolase family 28 protein n=1 Tax=uncultured Paludibaculum sp. TaxID=1765020 RepID=UPI002AAA63A1|nr:glycoside hydrolase family 28 protein [uncultured Paludibaculum sp.]
MDRRDLLSWSTRLAVGAAAMSAPVLAQPAHAGRRTFDVTAFGATGNGQTKDTAAVQKAIDACTEARGGVAYLPPGDYLCGTLVLKSHVTLFLEAGATIWGSKDLADYPPQPGPSAKGDANQKHLIFARGAEHVTIAGHGRLDGNGEAFWQKDPNGEPIGGKSYAGRLGWADVLHHWWKPLDRPSPMVELVDCRHVRIEDVRIENSPGWTVRPHACDHVVIRGVTIVNPYHGPNTDGIDPTCCSNVLISDCYIYTGDDAICLKSEPVYGIMRPSRNITVTNCVLSTTCNAFKIGTATRGDFENITFSNSVIWNDEVEPRQRALSGFALESVDGGRTANITISNIVMQNVRSPIMLRLGARGAGQTEKKAGSLRDVQIENVVATGSAITNCITGLPDANVENVRLNNIRIESSEGGPAAWAALVLAEIPRAYPEATMFGRLPSSGLYVRHVKGLKLRDVELVAEKTDHRPAVTLDDVKDVDIDGLTATAPGSDQAVLRMVESKHVFIRGSRALAGTRVFASVEGSGSECITLIGNELREAHEPVRRVKGAPDNAVQSVGNFTGAS